MKLKDVKFKSPGCSQGKLSGKKSILGLCLLASLALGVYGADIHSFKEGGRWDIEDTWEEHQVPGVEDDVYIRGPVEVYGGATCKNLFIESPGGILQNRIHYDQTLQVNGSITNNGIIKNSSRSLSINVTGDIKNIGNEWSNSATNINGTKKQYIVIQESETIKKVILHANITGTGYQWYKDDSPIGGANQSTYTFDPMTHDDIAKYYCKTTQPPQMSRIINPIPTAIELVYFKAKHVDNHILLQWETASEINNAGFHIWRSAKKDVEYTRITKHMIPAEK